MIQAYYCIDIKRFQQNLLTFQFYTLKSTALKKCVNILFLHKKLQFLVKLFMKLIKFSFSSFLIALLCFLKQWRKFTNKIEQNKSSSSLFAHKIASFLDTTKLFVQLRFLILLKNSFQLKAIRKNEIVAVFFNVFSLKTFL